MLNTRIAVCVTTFQRPKGLAKLARALGEMSVPPDVDVCFVVVDNENGSVDVAPAIGAHEVLRVVEPERGIPFARNRAVAEAGSVDAVVFFDDDEQPRPDCLERLVSVWRDSGADVVQGASVPAFETEPPAWVVRQEYFERKFAADGIVIPPFLARTSNVLIRREVFGVADPPFDVRLRMSGGSDSFLFRTAASSGFTFVAAASAVVIEDVPASRMSSRWLAHRHYRIGWGRSFHLRDQRPPLWRKIKRVLAGLATIITAPRAVWRGRPDPACMYTEGRRSVGYGWGLIVGLIGPAPSEYASIHGE
ncbi:MAG: glycosyltransferase [Actinomycetota bacterium]|nr:glycosyltransferase [Actinomycetota bacterium]